MLVMMHTVLIRTWTKLDDTRKLSARMRQNKYYRIYFAGIIRRKMLTSMPLILLKFATDDILQIFFSQ